LRHERTEEDADCAFAAGEGAAGGAAHVERAAAHGAARAAAKADAFATEEKVMDDDFEYLWKKRHEVVFRAQLSALYHRKRERFFSVMDRGINALGVACGSVAVGQIGGQAVAQAAAAVFTVAATIGLVVGLADRAQRHAALAGEFRRLEAQIAERGERDFTEEDVARWSAAALSIEAAEPPTLRALVAICQRDIEASSGHPDAVAPLPWHQRLLAHFFDFGAPTRPTAA